MPWSEHRQTDRRTESDAYEPTVQDAQVGSKMIRIEEIFTSSSTLNFFRFFLTLGDVSAGTSPLAIAETNSCRLRCTK